MLTCLFYILIAAPIVPLKRKWTVSVRLYVPFIYKRPSKISKHSHVRHFADDCVLYRQVK